MDPRTRMILFKLLSQHVFSEINGCVSTGKEANVYHAVTSSGCERAVKVSIGLSNLTSLYYFLAVLCSIKSSIGIDSGNKTKTFLLFVRQQ